LLLYSTAKNRHLFKRIPDSTIIEGVRRQDEKILTWLYDNYLQTVRHHVLKNSGTDAEVPDVFQEAIIILYTRIREDDFTLTTDLRGYFFGIAKNIWNVQLRRKLKNTEILHDYPDEADNDDYKNEVLEKIISRVFQKLKPDAQMILRLYSEGYSYDEIATRMNLKSDTYARRKKYLSKEALIELIKNDPDYRDYLNL
jgi:RNA polymerase sigma factor (sigma-70 family)